MKIAVDAMGAEAGTDAVIEGALSAIHEEKSIEVILVGREDIIARHMGQMGLSPNGLRCVPAADVVHMHDTATAPLRDKKNSSIAVGIDLVKTGQASAFVSTGHTGAVMATALLRFGKLRRVVRPCLPAIFPTHEGNRMVLVDVGANLDCKPIHLFQFAVLGSVYSKTMLGVSRPRIGLLNIGTEESKGGDVLVKTLRMLQDSSLNFAGNVEGKDLTSGKLDVVVCDGFVGNVILKFAEGFAETILRIMEQESGNDVSDACRAATQQLVHAIGTVFDYAEYGGVPLLGVNGTAIIAHGASSSKAIKNAIITGYKFSKQDINARIEQQLEQIGTRA